MRITHIDKVWKFKDRGYILVDEYVTTDDSPGVLMKSAYSLNTLYYIGESVNAFRLWRNFGITRFYNKDDVTDSINTNVSIVEKAKSSLLYGHPFISLLKKYGVCSIGFNEKKELWYGWSHRAICSFGVGSTMKKNSAGYIPSNKDEFINKTLEFYDINKNGSWVNIPESYKRKRLKSIDIDSMRGFNTGVEFHIEEYDEETKKTFDFSMFEPYPIQWGRGEWTAQTLDDAKQMAIDFAEDVG